MPKPANAHSVAAVIAATADRVASDTADLAQLATSTERSVYRHLARFEPVAAALVGVKARWLIGVWQANAAAALAKLYDASESVDARNWAVVAGIATDKLLVLSGQPTAIVQHTGEVRLSMPDLLDRIRRVRGKRIIDASDLASNSASKDASKT